MGYHDHLIDHAVSLSELNLPDEPKQVDLRRAVSAAYYGLFHLLTTEAAKNWKHERHRHRFSRMLEHETMRKRSSAVSSAYPPLKLVAESFVKLQQARLTADYDNSKVWSRDEVRELVAVAEDAMAFWPDIREKEVVQDYLLDLFVRERKP